MEWLLKGIEYCLESWPLSSLHVRLGDLSLNLQAEESGDLTIFENAIPKMSWPEIFVAFSTDAIHASTLFLLSSKFSTVDIVSWMMGWSSITDGRRVASLTVYLFCSTSVSSRWLKVHYAYVKSCYDTHEENCHLTSHLTERSPIVDALVITWHICCSEYSVVCIYTFLGHLISVVCEMNVL